MSVCDTCIHRRILEGRKRGIMDCDPDEEYCEECMQQFGYDEGCFMYEERENDATNFAGW